MEPTFVVRDAFTVVGLQERFTPEKDGTFFKDIWKQYMAHQKTIESLSDAKGWYGVCFCAGGDRGFDYLAGMAVPPDAACPEGLVMREVPAGHYAVFACTVNTIHDTYEHIHGTWLDASAYAPGHPRPDFEYYSPGTDSGDSAVFIHIAIRDKEAK